MPSQKLPTTSKYETLPEDLKAIAEKLIRKKFGIEHEPEVVNQRYDGPMPKFHKTVKISSRFTAASCVMDFSDYAIESGEAARAVRRKVEELQRRFGVPFDYHVDDYAYNVRY